MEIKSNERKLVYYPIESDEIIEIDLDKFLTSLYLTSNYDSKSGRRWQFQNDICSFFGICNTTYMPSEDESGSDYPHVDSHYGEKINLINELIDIDFIERKSSRTFYINEDIIDMDRVHTQEALHTIYLILHNKDKVSSPLIRELKETCVWSQNMNKKPFIAWHNNKFYPNATVDRLKELGWNAFYEENKDNLKKKREYFKSKEENK